MFFLPAKVNTTYQIQSKDGDFEGVGTKTFVFPYDIIYILENEWPHRMSQTLKNALPLRFQLSIAWWRRLTRHILSSHLHFFKNRPLTPQKISFMLYYCVFCYCCYVNWYSRRPLEYFCTKHIKNNIIITVFLHFCMATYQATASCATCQTRIRTF